MIVNENNVLKNKIRKEMRAPTWKIHTSPVHGQS